MIASPTPINECTASIEPATAPTDTASLPPIAYSRVNATEASTGAVNAATPAAVVTVGEQQRLHHEHDGDGQRAGVRPDEHGGHDPAQEVPAGTVGDREVEHLQGEDERRDQP